MIRDTLGKCSRIQGVCEHVQKGATTLSNGFWVPILRVEIFVGFKCLEQGLKEKTLSKL
jgi:hypothetical protein